MIALKLFTYYATRSVKNQIKKLFKTWVAVFIAVCFLFGVGIGLFGAAIDSIVNGDDQTIPDQTEEEILPGDEDELPFEMNFDAKEGICALAGVVLLSAFVYAAINSDKNGCAIFTAADVNILFPAPIKPQSVLLFKLMCQFGLSIVASLYLLFQVPNAVVNLGVPIAAVVGAIFLWIFLLIFLNVIQVLLFTLGSVNDTVKKLVRPTAYAVLITAAVGYTVYWKATGALPLDAAVRYFSYNGIEYIPVIGWIYGMLKSALYENYIMLAVYFVLSAAALVATVKAVWHIKADFYEEAMAKSEETAELQRSVERGVASKKINKKDRSEKLERDGMKYGSGANIYLFKSLYNRFRFAHFKIFTKTSETYLVAAVAAALIMKFGFKTDLFAPVALLLGVLVFFRSLGNPIAKDIELSYFTMIPDTAYKKVLYSALAGAIDCLLDLIPAMIAGTAILLGDPLEAIAWVAFIATVDFYSSSILTFIELSVPVSMAKTVKQVIAIMFIYFGLAPDAILIICGFALDRLPLFTLIAAGANFGLGVLFSIFSSVLVDRGRK